MAGCGPQPVAAVSLLLSVVVTITKRRQEQGLEEENKRSEA